MGPRGLHEQRRLGHLEPLRLRAPRRGLLEQVTDRVVPRGYDALGASPPVQVRERVQVVARRACTQATDLELLTPSAHVRRRDTRQIALGPEVVDRVLQVTLR